MSRWDVWKIFIYAAAWELALSCGNKNERLQRIYEGDAKSLSDSQKKDLADLYAIMVDELDRNPFQDFLGSMYMSLGFGDSRKGQFFTPYNVSQAMAHIAAANVGEAIEQNGFATINDSASGAGSTLIATLEKFYLSEINYQNSVWFVAQDLDETALLECYIQMSLIGAAGVVQQGDTLTAEYNYTLYTPMTVIEPIWTARWLQNKLPGYPCLFGFESREQAENDNQEKASQLKLEI